MTNRHSAVGTIGLSVVMCVLMASAASAQQASGIAGVVKDTSGAVLPGVTVEAVGAAGCAPSVGA